MRWELAQAEYKVIPKGEYKDKADDIELCRHRPEVIQKLEPENSLGAVWLVPFGFDPSQWFIADGERPAVY